MIALLLALPACHSSDPVATSPEPTSWVTPGCGDGILDADEACDEGDANNDTTPGACRTNCLAPTCGDGVVDAGEACDDGERWGGDGCDPTCILEGGAPEVEPNNTWDTANAGAGLVYGALPSDDVDCWGIVAASCGAIQVEQRGADCDPALLLSLHDPTGALVATGAPDASGCAILDPLTEPGARWIAAGTWSVCVAAVNGAEVRGYALAVSTPDPLVIGADAVGGDLDGDSVPDSCDGDGDGDGLLDAEDDCPDLSNGPETPALALSAGGFVTDWLAAGPFTTGASTKSCRPSEDTFVGEDGVLTPTLGDPAGERTWTAHLLGGDLFDFLGDYGSVGAPREVYTLVYLQSEAARPLTLAIGADDGVFAWWNGAQVLDISSCQGVVTDQFQAPVEVLAGWNTLLVKVRDQGGGWGLVARFFDGSTPVYDLEPSLVPGASWRPDQTDADGDGIGDVCDDDP